MTSMVDWDFAVNLGARVAGDGPEVTPADAAAAVTELRDDANRSTGLVRDFTGLVAHDNSAPVLVVDRRGWVQANADGFARILDPLVARLTEKKGTPQGLSLAIGSRVTGAEVGLMLGFLGTKVLGQFDPFHGLPDDGPSGAPPPTPAGCCSSPPTSSTSSASSASTRPTSASGSASTRRPTACSSPPCRGCATTSTPRCSRSPGPSSPRGMMDDVVRRVSEAVRGGGGSLLDVMGTPEQKEILDRITGVMSLLEGHADVVMDGVGPTRHPQRRPDPARFNERRKGVGTLDRILRRLLGLDAKMAQYRDGAAFVRARRRQGRHGRLQRRVGRARTPAQQVRDR